MVGRQGELVITKPMPCMPLFFWGDGDGSRMRDAYFNRYPGVWCHGDWVTITVRGTTIVHGRSDATLNRGGVRLGTSEFYSVINEVAGVSDSLVVHLEDSEGGLGQLILFVELRDAVIMDKQMRATICTALKTALSPRHVPDQIHVVPAVPRTSSGKLMEVPVKRILQGTPVDNVASKDSMANPDALVYFEAFFVQSQSQA
jgi:acetoacetyl-CoA synthetase